MAVVEAPSWGGTIGPKEMCALLAKVEAIRTKRRKLERETNVVALPTKSASGNKPTSSLAAKLATVERHLKLLQSNLDDLKRLKRLAELDSLIDALAFEEARLKEIRQRLDDDELLLLLLLN